MATLASVKGHLTILGIVPISEEMLPSLLHPLLSVINFVYPLCWFLSVLTYNITVVCFVLFEAETFIEFAECGFYCSVSFLHVVSYAILFQTRLELFALFKDADEMVQKRSRNPTMRLMYIQENEKTTKLSETLLKSAFIFAELFLFPSAALSFYLYYTTDLGADAFQLSLSSMVPWNWRTPLGYLGSVCAQYIWVHSGIFSVICVMPLIAGFCSLFQAFTVDLRDSLSKFDGYIRDSNKQSTASDRYEVYKKIKKIATFHSEALKLTERYSNNYKSLITVSFTVSSVLLCSALLGLDVAIHSGISDVLRMFVCFSVMKFYLVLLCILGDDVTISFGQVHDSIWECPWYEFPLDTQKLMPLMLASAQKPTFIKGYLNMRCTRESVKQIVKAAVSYFMVLREFGSS